MANNKTPLQKCINRVIDYQKWRRCDEELQQPNHVEIGADLDRLIKAAQAYADLPSKIEGMKMNLPDIFVNSGIIKECYKMRETTLDDILNLLKESGG